MGLLATATASSWTPLPSCGATAGPSQALRALDALHVGCALMVAARLPQIGLQLWTADKRQARAARSEGLVEWIEDGASRG